MNDRVTEKDLVFPALILLAQAKVHLTNPNVSTSVLKKSIFDNIEDDLTDIDLEPLKNRNDTKVDQVIRNLISNKTLQRVGLATYNSEDRTLKITDEGLSYLAEKLIGVMPASKEILEMKKQEIIAIENSNKDQPKASRPKMR